MTFMWPDVAQELGVFAIMVAAGTWLLRAAVTKWLDRSVDAYKIKLEHENEQAIERLRADLQTQTSEHQIRFTRLHEKQAATIEELYRLLCLLLRAAGAFFPGIHVNQAAGNAFDDALEEMRKYFEENLIYLSEEQCTDISGLLQRLHAAALDKRILSQDAPLGEEGREERIQSVKERWRLIQEDAPGVKQKLVDDFRVILGVLRPAKE